MKNKQILTFLILFTLFFSFSNTHVFSQTRPELNILIDASGSMGEQVEGRSKMAIAKEAISSLVDSLPANTRVGLRAYGSQYPESDKNCTDTKVLMPIATLDKEGLKNQLTPLNPSGWTPIEYALQQSYNDFGSSETSRYIVLVSDGQETCGGDPCAAAKDLEAKGIDVTINTIGFSVDQTTKDQLTCIAQATGGNFYDAKNTQELNDSLNEATEPVREFIAYTTEGEEIVGGSGFENPTQIYTDKQYTFEILNKENLFFFLNVPQNRRLTELSATIKTSDECGISFRMEQYGEDRKRVSCSAGVGINPNELVPQR
ncbi:VWA domain-containing protein [Candidatus Microgenomates bacterium]|nr:VWA domain-containing protein [Candidatus Microgenomates bacterium]